jgi:hypothetical protein
MNLLQLAMKIHQLISQAELTSCVQRNHVNLCDKHQVLENYLADTCLGDLYLRSDTGMHKHCRFERKATKDLVYQIFDRENWIYSTIHNVYMVYCKKWEEESAVFNHLNQATFIDTACLHIHFIFHISPSGPICISPSYCIYYFHVILQLFIQVN